MGIKCVHVLYIEIFSGNKSTPFLFIILLKYGHKLHRFEHVLFTVYLENYLQIYYGVNTNYLKRNENQRPFIPQLLGQKKSGTLRKMSDFKYDYQRKTINKGVYDSFCEIKKYITRS